MWVNKDSAFEKREMQKMRGSHFDGKIMFDMMTDKKQLHSIETSSARSRANKGHTILKASLLLGGTDPSQFQLCNRLSNECSLVIWYQLNCKLMYFEGFPSLGVKDYC